MWDWLGMFLNKKTVGKVEIAYQVIGNRTKFITHARHKYQNLLRRDEIDQKF